MRVEMTKSAEKQLRQAPEQVIYKFSTWRRSVQEDGLEATRKLSGYHDEPLKGQRKGERSIRLNRQWRAIYVELEDGNIRFLRVTEVTPHDY